MLRVTTKYTRLGDEEPIRVPLDNVTAVEVTIDTTEGITMKLYVDVDGTITLDPDAQGYARNGRWRRRDDVRQASLGEPSCPKCGGRMWDNRLTKHNPKAPDYRCRSRSCDGAIWPRREHA